MGNAWIVPVGIPFQKALATPFDSSENEVAHESGGAVNLFEGADRRIRRAMKEGSEAREI